MKTSINIRTANTINRTPAVSAFLANARRFEPMSREEEVEAFRALRAGDVSQREKIVNSNLLFVFSLSSKYAKGDEILDIVSVATIGMLSAIDKFDLSAGTRFLSFAIWHMRKEIKEYLYYVNPMIVKSNVGLIGGKANKVRENFLATEEREPSEEELIDILDRVYGIKVSKVDVVKGQMTSLDDKSFNSEDDATASEVGEIAVATASRNDYEKEMEKEDAEDKVSRMLNILSVKNRQIVKMYFGIGYESAMDYDAIAEEVGMTAERCRQIVQSSLKSLRENGRVKSLMRA